MACLGSRTAALGKGSAPSQGGSTFLTGLQSAAGQARAHMRGRVCRHGAMTVMLASGEITTELVWGFLKLSTRGLVSSGLLFPWEEGREGELRLCTAVAQLMQGSAGSPRASSVLRIVCGPSLAGHLPSLLTVQQPGTRGSLLHSQSPSWP